MRVLRFLLPPAGLLALLVTFAAGCSAPRAAAPPSAADDPSVVALVAGEPLTLAELERRYARATGGYDEAADDSLEAYQDFLERYVNFRVKVLEGRRAGYDTTARLLNEVSSYRTSFARPYLLDRAVLNPVIEELYARSSQMVDASHILLRVPATAPPADTLAAFEKLSAIRDSVLAGADFGELAVRHSEDPSARSEAGNLGHRGRLNYFSAGRMVKAFEDQAYTVPVGEVSPVFRTQFGYHILLVHDRREAVQDIQVAHVMARPAGATPEDSAAARAKIDSLATLLNAGADFADLARRFSDDAMSGQRGGDLGYVRYDNYQLVEPFRSVAFGLENVGDVSDVVETRFGYHLIKLLDRRQAKSYEERYEELKQTASRLPRTKEAEQRLATDVRARYGARLDTTAFYEAFAGLSMDSVLARLDGTLPADQQDVIVASLGDSTYTLGRVAAFTRTTNIPPQLSPTEQLLATAEAFLDDAALVYEAAALEQRDDEFRMIMDEFRDGLVLFELMGDSVWTAATEDSTALAAYFAAHADRYRFPERTRVVSFSSRSDSLLEAFASRYDAGTPLATLTDEAVTDSLYRIQVDTVLVAGSTGSVYDQALNLDDGARTGLLPYRDGQLLLINAGTEPARAKTFEEAQTEVVNDYQQLLEDRLIDRLRRRYGVRTFPQRLVRAFEDAAATTTASGS